MVNATPSYIAELLAAPDPIDDIGSGTVEIDIADMCSSSETQWRPARSYSGLACGPVVARNGSWRREVSQ